MQAQQQLINTVCTNLQCISLNKNVFFYYRNDNYHADDHDEKTMQIHAKKFKDILKLEDNSSNFETHYQNILEQNIKQIMDKMAQDILNFIKTKYFASLKEKLTTKFKGFQKITQQYLEENLKKGDLELLKNLVNYRSKTVEEPFSIFLANKKLPIICKDIEHECAQFSNKFTQILDVAIDNLEELDEIWQGKSKQVSKNKEEGQRSHGILAQRNDYNNLMNQSQDQSDQQNIQFAFNTHRIKRKTIKKRLRQKKRYQEQSIQLQQRQITPQKQMIERQSYFIQKSFEEEVKVTDKKLNVLYCTNPQKTLSNISLNYKDIKEINIFHHNFAKQDNLKRLLKLYPNLEKLSLNCYHEFGSSVIQSLGKTQRENMNFLQLYWNIDQYFLQYHSQEYFPYRKSSLNRRIQYTNISVQNLNELKKNKTVLLHNAQQISQFSNAKQIRTLHVIPYLQHTICKFKALENKNFHNLLTLNLMSIDFKQVLPSDFQKFISHNLSIKTLVLSRLQNINQRVNDFLRPLRLLQNLKNFSYRPKTPKRQLIQPNTIFSLTNLQSLFLDNAHFKNQSDEQDSSCLLGIYNLNQLKSLSLYQCRPIFTDLFAYLNPLVYDQMVSLNLAYTHVDQTLMPHVLRMKNLKYLSIDNLIISSSVLADGCQQFYNTNGQKWGLEYLSMLGRNNAKNRKLQEFQKMGTYLPELKYIYTNHQSFVYYDFQQFKKLQILCITASLFETIHPLTPHISKDIINMVEVPS